MGEVIGGGFYPSFYLIKGLDKMKLSYILWFLVSAIYFYTMLVFILSL
jgi:hypothetical protein